MIKFFTLRPTSNHRLFRHYLQTTAPSIQNLFFDSNLYREQIAKEIGESELFNIFYHLGHCEDDNTGNIIHKNKKLVYQNCIGIDVDGIDNKKIEEYIICLSNATQTDFNKCGIVASGNGLHYIILHASFRGEDHLSTRQAYKRMCDDINDKLILAKLPFKNVDPMAHKYNATLRFPHTLNRKPMKDPFSEDANVTQCLLINNKIENQNFSLDKWKKDDDAILLSKLISGGEKYHNNNSEHHHQSGENKFIPDVEYIFSACDFLGTQLREGGKNADEPLWRTALGVVGHFPESGTDLSWPHLISKEHDDYTYEETTWKTLDAIKIPPRTCGFIATLWDGCKVCPHYCKEKSPYGLSKWKAPTREIVEEVPFKSVPLSIVETPPLQQEELPPLPQEESIPVVKAPIIDSTTPSKPEIPLPPILPTLTTVTLPPHWTQSPLIQFPFPDKLAKEDYEMHLAEGFVLKEYTAKGKLKKVTPRYLQLAYYLSTIRPYLWIHSLNRLYFYDSGRWIQGEEAWFAGAAEKYLSTNVTPKDITNLISKAKSFHHTTIDYFELPKGLLNFSNGILDIGTRDFRPHGPKYPFQYVLPYTYEPAAKDCPVWDELLSNLTCSRKHLQTAIEEFIGYCLYGGEYRFAKALVLAGKGNNGKTTLIKIIQMLLGKSSCSSVSIPDLSNPFNAVGLEGKLVNISEESSKDCFRETGMLKAATGDSSIWVAKKHKDGYSMNNKAKIIMSYNEMPHLNDLSEGMRRRLMIVPFDLNLTLEPNKKIMNLMEKLQSELSAIVKRCLDAFAVVRKNDAFTECEEFKEQVEMMIQESSPEAMWLEDYVELTGNEEDFVPTAELFLSYQRTYPDFKCNVFTFGKRMKRLISGLNRKDISEYKLQKKEGKRVIVTRGFRGVKIIDSGFQIESTVGSGFPNNFDLL